MNINKVQLGMQLSLKQQTALKCMQFATEYLLKKAQYRLLNPLHASSFSHSQLNKSSQLMSQLSQYSSYKPSLIQKIADNNNNNINSNKQQQQQRQIQFQPYSPQKQIKQSQPISKQKPTSNSSPQQKQKPTLIRQQQPSHQPKPQSSVSEYDHLQFQRTSSQIINSNNNNNNNRLSSSQQQSISSSKKSKSKFQKVVKKKSNNKKSQSSSQTQAFPQQKFNFKKIKPNQIQQKQTSKQINISQSNKSKQNNISQIKKSQLINVQQNNNNKKFDNKFSDSDDSDDSFQNFPLPSQQKRKKSNYEKEVVPLIIKSQDMRSYRSSILSEKKVDFDVVSQHPSQHQISILNESGIFPKQQVESKQVLRTKLLKNDNNIIESDKIINAQNIQPLIGLKQKLDTQKKIIGKDKQNEQKDHNQSLLSKQQQQRKRQKEEQLNQIRKHLLKLQSFDVQQQTIMKKLLKIWNKDSSSLNTLKNIQWNQLNLPKPSFKFNTHLYAQVIE